MDAVNTHLSTCIKVIRREKRTASLRRRPKVTTFVTSEQQGARNEQATWSVRLQLIARWCHCV